MLSVFYIFYKNVVYQSLVYKWMIIEWIITNNKRTTLFSKPTNWKRQSKNKLK